MQDKFKEMLMSNCMDSKVKSNSVFEMGTDSSL